MGFNVGHVSPLPFLSLHTHSLFAFTTLASSFLLLFFFFLISLFAFRVPFPLPPCFFYGYISLPIYSFLHKCFIFSSIDMLSYYCIFLCSPLYVKCLMSLLFILSRFHNNLSFLCLYYILNNNLILRIKQSLSQLEQIQRHTYFGSVPRRDRLGFYAEIQIIFGPAALLRPSQQLVLKN